MFNACIGCLFHTLSFLLQSRHEMVLFCIIYCLSTAETVSLKKLFKIQNKAKTLRTSKFCPQTHITTFQTSNKYLDSATTSFLTFSACFSIPIIFSNLNLNCSNLPSLRNLQEQVKKAFCYQKLF